MKVMVVLLTSFLATGVAGSPALADERCLIGSWAMDGNGMAEWMQRHLPANVRMPVVESTGYLTLRADGRFVAAASLAASIETDDPVVTGGETSGGGFAGAGTWQVTGEGKLQLATARETHGNTVTVQTAGGSNAVPVPPVTRGGVMLYDFSCDGDHLETRMTIRGTGAPIVQGYVRVRS